MCSVFSLEGTSSCASKGCFAVTGNQLFDFAGSLGLASYNSLINNAQENFGEVTITYAVLRLRAFLMHQRSWI